MLVLKIMPLFHIIKSQKRIIILIINENKEKHIGPQLSQMQLHIKPHLLFIGCSVFYFVFTWGWGAFTASGGNSLSVVRLHVRTMILVPPSLLLLDHIQEIGNLFFADTNPETENVSFLLFYSYRLTLFLFCSLYKLFLHLCVCLFLIPLRPWKRYRTWVWPLHAPPLLCTPCVTANPFLCRPSRYAPTSTKHARLHTYYQLPHCKVM